MKKLLTILLIIVLPAFGFSSHIFFNAKIKKCRLVKRHNKIPSRKLFMPQTQYPLLRLKMIKDAFNSDDIAIAFNAAGTLTYNNQLDSRYLPGIDAPEGLSCLSSDSVQLSVSVVPLPKQAPLVIKLDVEAATSGSFTMQRTELDTIPLIYDFWLIDKYQKDSVDLRKTTNYFFSVDKTISASFGNNRFEVIIRQNAGLAVKVLSFAAVKSGEKANLTWTTANEGYTSKFTVERSIDGGQNYYALTTIAADSLGNYNASDNNPVTGTDMYRLKVTDMNDAVTYSNTAAISFQKTPGAEGNLTIYPNPSSTIINLTINQNTVLSANPLTASGNTSQPATYALKTTVAANYTVKILNITGAVLTTSTALSNSWQGYVSSLSPGTYVIRVVNNADNSVVGSSTFVKL